MLSHENEGNNLFPNTQDWITFLDAIGEMLDDFDVEVLDLLSGESM
jgi:hypothetical protein